MSRLLTIKEVAEKLSCSVRHVRRLRDLGLPYVQIGFDRGALRFKEEDVEAWISSQTRTTSVTANNNDDEGEDAND